MRCIKSRLHIDDGSARPGPCQARVILARVWLLLVPMMLVGCYETSETPLIVADDTYRTLPDRFALTTSGQAPFVAGYTFRKRGNGFDVKKEDGSTAGYLTLRRTEAGIIGQFAANKQYFYLFLRQIGSTYEARHISSDDWKRLVTNNAAAQEIAARGAVRIDDSIFLVLRDAATLESLHRMAQAQRAANYTITPRVLTAVEVTLQDRGPLSRPASAAAAPARIVGDDPARLPSFPLSTTRNPLRDRPDMTICNDTTYETSVAVVRSNGTFAAWTKDSWLAEGFFPVAPASCVEMRFGFGQSASSGYLSVARKIGGRWVTLTYRERPSAFPDSGGQSVFAPANQPICWPNAGEPTSVNPNVSCEGSPRNVRFNIAYGKAGNTTNIVLKITDDGFLEERTKTSYR